MLVPIVVLWLGQGAERALHDEEIRRWAAARELLAVSPPAAPGPVYDPRSAQQIEAWLDEARTTMGNNGPSEALERARVSLAAHPELPQAAWLLAESYAIEAHAANPDSEARGDALSELARKLEGPRAASASAVPSQAGRQALAGAGLAEVALRLSGPRPHDRVFLDGAALGSHRAPMLTPGRHQLQVSRAQRSVSASWVEVDASGVVRMADPTLACSELDLADVALGRDAPRAAPGIACGLWAVAHPTPVGGVEVSRCEGSRCGRWQPMLALHGPSAALARTGSGATDEAHPWPTWLTWGLIGIGVGATTGIVLWQTGAFERSAPPTEYVFTGPTAAAYRF